MAQQFVLVRQSVQLETQLLKYFRCDGCCCCCCRSCPLKWSLGEQIPRTLCSALQSPTEYIIRLYMYAWTKVIIFSDSYLETEPPSCGNRQALSSASATVTTVRISEWSQQPPIDWRTANAPVGTASVFFSHNKSANNFCHDLSAKQTRRCRQGRHPSILRGVVQPIGSRDMSCHASFATTHRGNRRLVTRQKGPSDPVPG